MTDKEAQRLVAIDSRIQELSDEYYKIVAPNPQELTQTEELLTSILYHMRHEVNEPLGDSVAKYVLAHRVMYNRHG